LEAIQFMTGLPSCANRERPPLILGPSSLHGSVVAEASCATLQRVPVLAAVLVVQPAGHAECRAN
jgi:hypothetical protein